MRYAHLVLLCLVLAPGCDDETAVGPLSVPEPRTRSELVVCTDQPQLGDTWELDGVPRDIQLDAEGNVYLIGVRSPACVPEDAFEGSFGLLAKMGPRGDVRWVRGWQDSALMAAVSPSGETMVLAGEDEVFLIGANGGVRAERRRGSGDGVVLDATSTGFFFSASRVDADPITFNGVSFEPEIASGTYVVSLDREVSPQLVFELPAALGPPSARDLAGLSNGDVVTTHIGADPELNREVTVITRSGARRWTTSIPKSNVHPRLYALADDSVVLQVGATLSRLSSDGVLLWSRDYADSVHAMTGNRAFSGTQNVAMYAAASPKKLVITFVADPSEGPLETSEGPITPDGQDIGFATLNIETGLFEHIRLDVAPGDQYIVDPVVHDDGALVASVVTPSPKELEKDVIARFRLP